MRTDKNELGEGERGQRTGSCELHTGILQCRGARVWHGLDELSHGLNMNTAISETLASQSIVIGLFTSTENIHGAKKMITNVKSSAHLQLLSVMKHMHQSRV